MLTNPLRELRHRGHPAGHPPVLGEEILQTVRAAEFIKGAEKLKRRSHPRRSTPGGGCGSSEVRTGARQVRRLGAGADTTAPSEGGKGTHPCRRAPRMTEQPESALSSPASITGAPNDSITCSQKASYTLGGVGFDHNSPTCRAAAARGLPVP
jgi:hypothetical protein